MKQSFTASIWHEQDWVIAQCVEVDVASQGETEAEALQNLQEALKLHFTPPHATEFPHLYTVEVELNAA